LELLANQLKSDDAANSQLSMPALSERIAKGLHVNPDEVAILAISGKMAAPVFYGAVGVAQCGTDSAFEHFCLDARGSRPNIVNNFSTLCRASAFEGVKGDR
jgi:hypothetical protein